MNSKLSPTHAVVGNSSDHSLDVIIIDDDEDIYIDDESDEIQVLEVIHKHIPKPCIQYIDSSSPPLLAPSNGFTTVNADEEELDEDMAEEVVNSGDGDDVCMQVIDDSEEVVVEDRAVAMDAPKEEELLVVGVSNGEKKRCQLTSASTSTTTGARDETTGPTVPKKDRPFGTMTTAILTSKRCLVKPKAKPNLNFKTNYENYLKSFTDRMQALNAGEELTNDLCGQLADVFGNLAANNHKFLQSAQFAKLMDVFAKEVLDFGEAVRVVRHHNDLLIELKRLTLKAKAAAPGVKGRALKIEKLTLSLKSIQRQITAAENEVFDYEAMDLNTSFCSLPKLYRKAEEVWQKREELLHRSTNSGRVLFKRFRYDKTEYPVVNALVEKLFNGHMKRLKLRSKARGYIDESFTFIDVRKAIIDEIKEKALEVKDVESMAADVYEDLIKERKVRREKEWEETFETLETCDDLQPEAFVGSDPRIDLEIAKNSKHFERIREELFQKYTVEDKRLNGESVLSEGRPEWHADLLEATEERFESLDVTDGDLEDDEEKSDDEEEVMATTSDIPVPDCTAAAVTTTTGADEEPPQTETSAANSVEDSRVESTTTAAEEVLIE